MPELDTRIFVPITNVIPEDINLRDSTAGTSQDGEFMQLYESIVYRARTRGIKHALLQPIIITPERNDRGEPIDGMYKLVDGRQRLSCFEKAKEKYPDMGFGEIAATIDSSIKDEADMMEAQLNANETRVKTSKKDQAKLLLTLDALFQSKGQPLTADQMAEKFGRSTTWVSTTLGLKTLSEDCLEAFSQGDLQITDARILSKLPQEHQEFWLQEYLTLDKADREEWRLKVDNHLAELKKNKDAAPKSGPVLRARKSAQMKDRYENPHPEDSSRTWQECLEFYFQIDEESQQEKEAQKQAKELSRLARLKRETEDKADDIRRQEEELAKKQAEFEAKFGHLTS